MIATILLTLVLLLVTASLLKSNQFVHLKGDRGLPFFGLFFEIVAAKSAGKIDQFFRAQAKKHGNIFKIRSLARTVVFVTDPSAIKQVLTQPKIFKRMDIFQRSVIDLMPYALFVMPTNDMWKHHRKLMLPGFGPTHLQHTVAVANQTMNRFKNLMKDTKFTINVHAAMTSIALDVIGQIAFGHEFDSVKSFASNSKNEDKDMIMSFSKLVSFRNGTPWFLWPWFGYSYKGKASKKIANFFQHTIKMLKRKNIEGEASKNVLGRLLSAEDVKMNF